MRRSASLVSERVASSEVESSDSATWPTFSSPTVNRLSGLLKRIRNHGSNRSNKKTQHCQGTQNTGEVVSLWWKEDKRMVKHVSGVSKTPNTSRVYCILTILLAHFLPLIDVLFLFALVRLLGSPRTAKRYQSVTVRLNKKKRRSCHWSSVIFERYNWTAYFHYYKNKIIWRSERQWFVSSRIDKTAWSLPKCHTVYFKVACNM